MSDSSAIPLLDPTSLTIVCCVESGPLEPMAMRMIESLRRHGGRWSQTQVWAITPRFGPSLAPATLKKFDELNVNYQILREKHPYIWFSMWNKMAALTHVEAKVQTDYVAFIDTDVIFTGEPEQLVSGDFSACVHGTKHLGTSGPDDANEALWKAQCDVAGISVDDLPWVQTPVDGARIRLYFNSGIFSYRRVTGYGKQWADVCRAILDARVGQSASKNHFTDQIALSLALAKSGLSWQPLPRSHNFDVASWEKNEDTAGIAGARLLHYHDAMGAHFWPQFLALIEKAHPELHAWLQPLGPAVDPSPKATQMMAKALKTKRVLERNKYQSKMNLF